MINSIVKKVRKQRDFGYNEKGFKLISLEVKINETKEHYILGIENNKDFKSYNYICKSLNELYKTLKECDL